MSLQAGLVETDTDRERRPESGGGRARERETMRVSPRCSLATNLIEFHISLIAKAQRDDVDSMRSVLHNMRNPVASLERGHA